MHLDEDAQAACEIPGPVNDICIHVGQKNKLSHKVRSIKNAIRAIMILSPFVVVTTLIFSGQAALYSLLGITAALKVGYERKNEA